MDCVTCMLIGMCMMCGPGIGAASVGRPMTQTELTAALKNMLERYDVEVEPRPTSAPRIARTQSFSLLDPKYRGIGIGKRNKASKVDPYYFTYGIGKRKATSGENDQDLITAFMENAELSSDVPSNDVIQRTSRSHSSDAGLSGSVHDHVLSLGAMNSIPNFNTDLYKYIFNHMLEKAKLAKSREFLEKETKELSLRRQRHEKIDPFSYLMGIGR